MNARIIVRDDGDLTAPRLYDAHHDLAPQPQPGYVLELVEIPGYTAPVVEQCAIVKVGAGTGLEVRCRATKKPAPVEDLDAESKPGPKRGAKPSRPVCLDCLAAGEPDDRHRTANCPHRPDCPRGDL